MEDMRRLLPHSKKESKINCAKNMDEINEICDLKSCNNCLFFEVKKKQDLYLWVAKSPNGPSGKFFVQNVHTMDELKLTGNCLHGSRPILSFDDQFDSAPHWKLLKELFTQVFGTPKGHPKSKPFIDHVFTFSICDGNIWFRNYQVVEDEISRKRSDTKIVEIGPRFVLQPMKIFNQSFYGETLYQNINFISPNVFRAAKKRSTGYAQRKESKIQTKKRKSQPLVKEEDFSEVFE